VPKVCHREEIRESLVQRETLLERLERGRVVGIVGGSVTDVCLWQSLGCPTTGKSIMREHKYCGKKGNIILN